MLDRFLNSNEAMVFCAALIGPLAYTITRSYGRLAGNQTFKFPHALFFIVSLLVIYGSAIGILGLGIGSKLAHGNVSNEVSTSRFWNLSLGFLIASFLILYSAYTLRNNMPEDAPSRMRRDEEDFVKEWGK